MNDIKEVHDSRKLVSEMDQKLDYPKYSSSRIIYAETPLDGEILFSKTLSLIAQIMSIRTTMPPFIPIEHHF